MRLSLVLLAALLTGCAGGVVIPTKLEPPSPRLMQAPTPLPDVKVGDDLYQANASCRAEYGRETGKLKGLQTYTRTILKK